MTYTADDFAKARFAEHELGGIAARCGGLVSKPWVMGDATLSDSDMAAYGWVPVREATPVSLDTLETAWGAAEPINPYDPPRKGDVIIVKQRRAYTVSVADEDGAGVGLTQHLVRVLSRAPQREPWADLADDLADRSALMDEDASETAAKALHAAGWRKCGDDDD